MALFVVSSGYEQKIIHDYFGYDNEEIIITGLARWDVLEDKSDPAHKEYPADAYMEKLAGGYQRGAVQKK